MKRALAQRFEFIADGCAAVFLGCAVGVSAFHLLAPVAVQPALGAYVAAAGVVAHWAGRSLLSRVGQRVPVVGVANLELWGGVSDSSSVQAPVSKPVQPEPESATVVRLFDPAEAATSGEWARRHHRLANEFSPAAPPDASKSLHEALHQLRQSLASRR